MIDVTVEIDATQVNEAIRAAKGRLTRSRLTALAKKIAQSLRDAAKANIRTAGKGSWAPLSKWTKARTGRSRPFQSLLAGIVAKEVPLADPITYGVGVMYHKDPRLSQHAEGYPIPAVSGRIMVIPLLRPSFLKARNLSRHSTIDRAKFFGFKSRKSSRVPPRRVMPNIQEATEMAKRGVEDYSREVERAINAARARRLAKRP